MSITMKDGVTRQNIRTGPQGWAQKFRRVAAGYLWSLERTWVCFREINLGVVPGVDWPGRARKQGDPLKDYGLIWGPRDKELNQSK